MRPLLTRPQGRVLRALVHALGPFDGVQDRQFPPVIVDLFTTDDWVSLTFTGHRHLIALVVPGTTGPTLGEIAIAGQIVAEAQIVAATIVAGGVALSIRVLTIDDSS